MFNFEKLDVWQEAIQFADLVYELTGNFPDEERFGLTNQMRRAAVSVSSNIAEGSSRVSRTDFARFVEIATGSLFEVVSQTTIALRRKIIAQSDYNEIYATAQKAEQDAQRFAQVIIRGIALNPQLSTRDPQRS
jgi:four helix bundle protein